MTGVSQVRYWPVSDVHRLSLNLGLLRHFKCIIDLDAEVSDRAFQLAVPEEELHCPKVLGPAIRDAFVLRIECVP